MCFSTGRDSVEKLIDPRLTDQSLVHAAARLNKQRRASGLIASVFQKNPIHLTLRTHSHFGDGAFNATGPRVWNSLFVHI